MSVVNNGVIMVLVLAGLGLSAQDRKQTPCVEVNTPRDHAPQTPPEWRTGIVYLPGFYVTFNHQVYVAVKRCSFYEDFKMPGRAPSAWVAVGKGGKR